MSTDRTVRRVVVAINPAAAFGARTGVGVQTVEALRAAGHEVIALQEADGSALAAAGRRALDVAPDTAPDALIVVGGDGMVNLGANLVAGTSVPLGIVPSGTGNDMARGLGIPHDDTDAAIRALIAALDRRPRTIDAARMTFSDADGRPVERWFACMLSAGFDAIVNERANRMRRPRGPSRYILAMLIELVRLRPIPYRLVLDDDVIETEASLVALGNAVSLGGGMKVTPHAKLDDGLLDVAVVRPMSRIGFLRLFPRVYEGSHVRDPRVVVHRARRVRIEGPVVAYADGERVGPLPVDVEVVPKALRVLA